MMLSDFISSVINAGQRILTVLCNGKSDVRSPQESAPYGDDSSPIKGVRIVYSRTNSINQPGIALGVINTSQQAQPGEKRHYATDTAGAVQCSVWFKGSGVIVYTGNSMELLGNANHATQYEALNTQLQNYLTQLLSAIGTGCSSGGGAFTPPPGGLDLSPAKLTNIKTQ